MKGYVFISEKQSNIKDYTNDIQEILETYNGISQIKVDKSLQDNQKISLYRFTNELKEINYSYGRYEFAISGDLLYEEDIIFNEFIQSKDRNKYMADLGGINTFATLVDQTFTAWNNVTRVEPIYWAETNERIVIGTKAILVHLLAHNTRIPIYEPTSMISFLNNGFYADDHTPYKGLNILEANRKIEITNNTVVINPIDDFEQNLYSIDPSNQDYDELTEAFLNSFLFIKRTKTELSTGLTGGKDSRMVVAALTHLGIDFKAQTTGFETTPDVLVAQQIANTLKINHAFNEPAAGSSSIDVDLYSRTVNTIKNSEGLLYSYENLGGTSKNFNPNKMKFGGQGGESLRGGYARKHQFTDKSQVERFMLNAFIKYKDFFVSEEVDKYSDFIKNFIHEESGHLKANDILNHFFLKYRTGRWSSGSRPFYTSLSYAYSPLFENQLVKKAQMIDTVYGANDNILYNILQRVAPELIDIPFADDRWSFESKHPYHKYGINSWISRKPIQATSKLSSFNWRKNVLTTSKKQFEEVIFGNEHSALFDIVNKEKLKGLFTSKVQNPAKYDTLLWGLYTGNLLLSNEWYKKVNKKSRISIKVPEKTSESIPGVIEEIRHIPSEYLISKHKQLQVTNQDDVTSIIKWEQFEDPMMYFQLFDGNFMTPPSQKFNEYSKVRGTKVKFAFEIEKMLPNNFDLDVYFIQYNEKERIKSEVNNFYIDQPKKIYEFVIPLLQQTVNYKIAFRVGKTTFENQFAVNQMRVEFLN